MHAISDGTILFLILSVTFNIGMMAYIATDFTDREDAE